MVLTATVSLALVFRLYLHLRLLSRLLSSDLFCFYHLHHLLYPLHINALLISPLLQNPHPWMPPRCQKELHNWPCRNILRGSVLAAGDVGFYLLFSCLCNCLPHCRVCPITTPVTLWHSLHYPPHHSMVETIQRLPNLRGHDPRLCHVDEHCLSFCGVKHPHVRASNPSHPITCDSCYRLCHTICKLQITAIQSLSDDIMTLPRYLKEDTTMRGQT